MRLPLSRPLAALAVAGGALALVPGSASAGLTGEDVLLSVSVGSDYSASATVYAKDNTGEKFEIVLVRASSAPAQDNKVQQLGPLTASVGGGGDPSQPATFTAVVQGGGPVLDSFYVVVTCTTSSACTETGRDLTSHGPA